MTMSAGAIFVLNENNIKVPKQFSIVGFDDMPDSSIFGFEAHHHSLSIDLAGRIMRKTGG